MTGDARAFPSDGADDGADAPSIAPEEVIEQIASGGSPLPADLSALSRPDDDIVATFISLWPRLEPERRRELLASMQQLSDADLTLDFHRIHLSAMRDGDPATRILAIRGLWGEEPVEYMRLLAGQIRDDAESNVRAACADALGQWVLSAEFGLLDEEDGDHLCATLRDVAEDVTEEDEVRGRALEALGARSEEWVSELIGDTYETGGHRMRLASVRAMGRNADDDWLPVLIHNFDDDDAEIRAAAATAAGRLLIDSVIDPLMALVDDSDEEVQVAAIHAIGEIAGDLAGRVLTGLLERDEPHLAQAAQEALAEVRLFSADAAGPEDPSGEQSLGEYSE